MSIMPSEPESKTSYTPCTSAGCLNPGTIFGIYDDGETVARVNYCSYCAGLLYREFTPISSVAAPDLRAQVIAVLPLPGELMTPEVWDRVVDGLLMPGRDDA